MNVDLAQLDWRKSSYSGDSGGQCVEVAIAWRKSSYSGDNGGQCVEIATCPGTVHVRDSKDPAGPALAFTPDAWSAFVGWAGEATPAALRGQ
ncbi:DUF397 domain-containing protein [Actinacidiphila rubida]|uniref:DUF397 domain-containing protein n=1 Tax=Actinacidiphila rubida TaxID=310780 RepID=A0A1H8GS02_9ACTN|nr:DUF397 domain-containing protein [Actinacidiphila rubida]SEN46600.1 protein of unknown function [Actinacidiphila rubida]